MKDKKLLNWHKKKFYNDTPQNLAKPVNCGGGSPCERL